MIRNREVATEQANHLIDASVREAGPPYALPHALSPDPIFMHQRRWKWHKNRPMWALAARDGSIRTMPLNPSREHCVTQGVESNILEMYN